MKVSQIEDIKKDLNKLFEHHRVLYGIVNEFKQTKNGWSKRRVTYFALAPANIWDYSHIINITGQIAAITGFQESRSGGIWVSDDPKDIRYLLESRIGLEQKSLKYSDLTY